MRFLEFFLCFHILQSYPNIWTRAVLESPRHLQHMIIGVSSIHAYKTCSVNFLSLLRSVRSYFFHPKAIRKFLWKCVLQFSIHFSTVDNNLRHKNILCYWFMLKSGQNMICRIIKIKNKHEMQSQIAVKLYFYEHQRMLKQQHYNTDY